MNEIYLLNESEFWAKVKKNLEDGNLSYVKKALIIAAKTYAYTSVTYWTFRLATEVYKHVFDNAFKICKIHKGKKRTMCMLEQQVMAVERYNSILAWGLRNCKQTNEPGKCNETIKSRLDKNKLKIKKMRARIKEIETSPSFKEKVSKIFRK